jgi:HEAT repeat protein/cyclophilin family peptidyl-prolyl cis-trans isomerase
MSWVARLEQQRMLRDETAARDESPQAAARSIQPARTADLTALVRDSEPAVRRRAALAIGRVGRADGVDALAGVLGDSEEEVRAAAAFSLGLIGASSGVEPLLAALKDSSALVRGRAIEGLGLIGQPAAATPIADAASGCRTLFVDIAPDDESPKSPEIESCRLALFALVRLKQYDALARIALDERGLPVSRWWPVAYALQRIGDKRAVPALLSLASSDGVYTVAFALRGLGAAGDAQAVPLALAIAGRQTADLKLRVAAIRMLGQVGGAAAVDPLKRLVVDQATPRNVALEAVMALGTIGDPRAFDLLLDEFTDPWAAIRAAAITGAAKINPNGFLLAVSSIGADRDWSVRAALASVLETFPGDRVQTAIQDLAADPDARVHPPALRALAKVGSPALVPKLFESLEASDFVERATAAELVGEAHPDGGMERLIAAYARGESDAAYDARAATIVALGHYPAEEAKAGIRKGLTDKDWAVRIRAAEVLHTLGELAVMPGVPAPTRQPDAYFESAALLHPTFSPHAFIELRAGTIEIELNVVDAPVTSQSFIELARKGFFNGLAIHRLVPNFVIQAGDPRGDSEGGPGFSLRDEDSPLPFVRGTVGMALDWKDTAGSQFFITLSPQPHLDAKYTVFGHVVKGTELLDSVAQWDVIERVRIWDGVSFQ